MLPTLVDTKNGRFVVLPNDLLGKRLIKTQDYEPHFAFVAKKIVTTDSVCIDCGANLGYHTVKMAELAGPNGRVFAFEPQRLICQQLGGNIFLNNLANVEIFNVALGNKNTVVEIELVDLSTSELNTGAACVNGGGERVVMVKLDDFQLKSVKLIKLDVQGCELEVLRGATELVAESRPIIFFETDEPFLKKFNTGSEMLLNHVLSLNYIILRLGCFPGWDHLAIPKEKKDLVDKIMDGFWCKYDTFEGSSIKINFDREKYTDEVYGSFVVTP